MRRIKLLFTLVLFFMIQEKSYAQATNVVTGLNSPYALAFNGNDLYIAEYYGNKISKIDITNSAPTAIDVVTGLNQPMSIVLKGNELYIAEYGANKVSKIDITASSPTVVDVVTGLTVPSVLAFNGNELYIAENNGNKISKIDITASVITAVDVITGLQNVSDFIFNGNDLYISESSGNKVSKIDITTTAPTATAIVTGLNNPSALTLKGNDLYIAEYNSNKISKIDITASSPTAIDVVIGLSGPVALLFKDNSLYIAEYIANKISKFIDCSSNTGIDIKNACNSYTWIDGNTYTSSNNTAIHTLTNVAGCDSIVTLNLTIDSVNIGTSVSASTITANLSGANYKWINCSDNSIITGETAQSFTAITNGNYAVIITNGTCTDTSACVEINSLSIKEDKSNYFSMYPNPTTGLIKINTTEEINLIEIFSITGQKVACFKETEFSIETLNSGIYTIRIQYAKGILMKKIIKK